VQCRSFGTAEAMKKDGFSNVTHEYLSVTALGEAETKLRADKDQEPGQNPYHPVRQHLPGTVRQRPFTRLTLNL
jgi:hypothetical protein